MSDCKKCGGRGVMPARIVGREAIAERCPECGGRELNIMPMFAVDTGRIQALERVARAAGEWRDALEWHRQPLRSAREHSESAGNLRKKMLALESALTALEEGGESDG